MSAWVLTEDTDAIWMPTKKNQESFYCDQARFYNHQVFEATRHCYHLELIFQFNRTEIGAFYLANGILQPLEYWLIYIQCTSFSIVVRFYLLKIKTLFFFSNVCSPNKIFILFHPKNLIFCNFIRFCVFHSIYFLCFFLS